MPTPIRRLHGGKIKGRKHEPKYALGRPPCPADVQADPAALAYWERLAERLELCAVLNTSHGEALGLLAQTLADFDRARGEYRATGFQNLLTDEIRDRNGTLLRCRVIEHPLIRRIERVTLIASRLLGEFGLTPVTQSRVEAKQQAAADAFEVFLGGKRPR
jgi:hypothetical protein